MEEKRMKDLHPLPLKTANNLGAVIDWTLEKWPDGWVAYVPQTGVVEQGDTAEEAAANLKKAVLFTLQS